MKNCPLTQWWWWWWWWFLTPVPFPNYLLSFLSVPFSPSSYSSSHFSTPSPLSFPLLCFTALRYLKNSITWEATPLHGKNLDGMLLSASLSLVPSVCSGKCHKRWKINKGKDSGCIPHRKPHHLYSVEKAFKENSLLYSREVTGTGSGQRKAAKRGPDAAPSLESLVLGHLGGWAVPPPKLILGPPTPRPHSRHLRVWLPCIQHEVPRLPPRRDSVLWSCLLLVCQIAVLMLSAMSDQSANNTTGWNLNNADAQRQGYVDWTSKGKQR